MRGQFGRQPDRRRAVSAADDADGASFLRGKSQQRSADKSEEDTHLSSTAEKQRLGIGKKRTKVGRSTNAHENQARIYTKFYTKIQVVKKACIDFFACACNQLTCCSKDIRIRHKRVAQYNCAFSTIAGHVCHDISKGLQFIPGYTGGTGNGTNQGLSICS